MIFGFIIGIVIAHVLTFVRVDQTIISGIKDMIKFDIGHTGYYLLMGIAGGISRVMIGGLLSGIVVAYLLTLVKFDNFLIVGLKELFKYNLSTGGYYLLFAIIGAGLSFLKVVRMFLSPLLFMVKRKA